MFSYYQEVKVTKYTKVFKISLRKYKINWGKIIFEKLMWKMLLNLSFGWIIKLSLNVSLGKFEQNNNWNEHIIIWYILTTATFLIFEELLIEVLDPV